jgi:hypothetical protein
MEFVEKISCKNPVSYFTKFRPIVDALKRADGITDMKLRVAFRHLCEKHLEIIPSLILNLGTG